MINILTGSIEEPGEPFIVEPISMFLRIGLLTYKPKNTRIYHSNYDIYYREYNEINIKKNVKSVFFAATSIGNNIYQGGMRWLNGESRDIIRNLHKPLLLGLKFLEIPQSQGILSNILNFCLEGLKRLSECYVKDDKIQEYFRKYYTIIVKYINHKSRGNLSHAFFICERDNYPKEINNIFIGNIWSYDDIVNISNMIGNINYLNVNERFDEVNIITETLEKILKTKREKFKNKLQT
tara:strand:- start:397 stop:1107 length:711 start_codon:yes stop_codon:yes gene_type:complete